MRAGGRSLPRDPGGEAPQQACEEQASVLVGEAQLGVEPLVRPRQ